MKGIGGMQIMSMLDLMCCGMGGALLLLLIMAAARPVQAPPSPLVVIRCTVAASSPRCELGLRFREPGSTQWKRCSLQHPVAGQVVFFAATSEQDSGGEVMLALVNPAEGVWRFQPYIVDFPAGRTSTRPTVVKLEAIGQRLDGPASQVESTGAALEYPGDFDDEWVVSIRES